MAALSTYAANKVLDHLRGKTSFTMPTSFKALFRATAGSNAASPRSTAVTVGQVTVPATPNGRTYRCTTAGTTGAGEPTWPTTSGGTVADGGAVWTEMTPDWQANNSNVTGIEANYTGYARVTTAGADWTAASAGSSPNATATNFGADTAGTNLIIAVAHYDASTVGNLIDFEVLTAPLLVSPGITPSFAIGADVLTLS